MVSTCAQHSGLLEKIEDVRKDGQEVKDVVFGNGTIGLKTSLDRLQIWKELEDEKAEEKAKDVKARNIRYERYAVVLIFLLLGTIISNVVTLISK